MPYASLPDRIKSCSTPADNGCWVWNRKLTTAGYGRTPYQGKSMYAHRLAYVAFKGQIPDNMHLDHLCRNPACVNPEHLEAVTHKVNVQRGLRGVLNPQRLVTYCKHGHEFTEKNTYWKLNPNTDRKTRMCITCKNFRKTKAYRSLFWQL